jgi:hypothetical protein
MHRDARSIKHKTYTRCSFRYINSKCFLRRWLSCLSEKFPSLYGTQSYITVSLTTRIRSLSRIMWLCLMSLQPVSIMLLFPSAYVSKVACPFKLYKQIVICLLRLFHMCCVSYRHLFGNLFCSINIRLWISLHVTPKALLCMVMSVRWNCDKRRRNLLACIVTILVKCMLKMQA